MGDKSNLFIWCLTDRLGRKIRLKPLRVETPSHLFPKQLIRNIHARIHLRLVIPPEPVDILFRRHRGLSIMPGVETAFAPGIVFANRRTDLATPDDHRFSGYRISAGRFPGMFAGFVFCDLKTCHGF